MGSERPHRPGTGDPVRDLVLAYLTHHLEALREHERGNPEAPGTSVEPISIHTLRIDCRRLRSALGTYRTVFRPGTVDELREELRWVGQALSRARDAQVLRGHLEEVVQAQPPELLPGPVADRIEAYPAEEERAGTKEALAALHSERYAGLVDALERLVRDPPWSRAGDEPVARAVPRLLRRDARRLERAVRRIDRTPAGPARDAAVHEARKKAKRFRYAAESAVPAYGRRAERIVTTAKEIQTILGEHHDAVVARATLRCLAAHAHEAGEGEFTYGRLDAIEEARAARALDEFERARALLPHHRLPGLR